MPIATPEAYAEMLGRAKEHAYAFPAVNCTSSETVNAALTAVPPFARIARAPTIAVKEREFVEAGRALAGVSVVPCASASSTAAAGSRWSTERRT